MLIHAYAQGQGTCGCKLLSAGRNTRLFATEDCDVSFDKNKGDGSGDVRAFCVV